MSADLNKLEGLVGRLEMAVQRQEALYNKPGLSPKPTSIPPPAGGNGSIPPSIKAYDDSVNNALKAFVAVSKKIGGPIGQMADKVSVAFDSQRRAIWEGIGRPEPNDNQKQQLLQPVVEQVGIVCAFKEQNKTNKSVFNHLAAVSEGLSALGWLGVKPTPGPYVKEMFDVAMFYVNRVRSENKGDNNHSEWAKSWCDVFFALQGYIKQWHTTGLSWNSAPGSQPSGTTPKSGGGAPPPPPPPSNDLLTQMASKQSGGGGKDQGRQALFAELNKGDAITSGLKKVTADMQTHKNPQLRTQSTVPADKGKSPQKSVSPSGKAGIEKPPKIELKNQKVWEIEYHKDNRQIQIQADLKHSVYIFRCENSVIQIKGKANSVTVDSCKKTSVVFDALLSQVEVINCQSIELQTLGSLPTISIQKTDGCQVYLSKESLNAEIVTSKSSEMNILVPKGADGDFTEFPVPEQFKTTYNVKENKLQTQVSDIV
ncbi:unnamed protein product [Meloidogyne enterolobii]|uniref:Uncharacterized protein n=2 Tax=Meloidogyne enterolobii TaxID=390850 RepID=A0ACB1AJJ9_MELEN